MNRLTVITLSLALASLLSASRAEALKFELVNAKDLPAGVKTALWVRDCGPSFGDKQCDEDERGFAVGDGARLAQVLSQRRFDEIWLASNGGVLDEGLAVGEVFRRFQVTVRVPPDATASARAPSPFLAGRFVSSTTEPPIRFTWRRCF